MRATEWWRLSILSGWLPGGSTMRPVTTAAELGRPAPEADAAEEAPARTDRAGTAEDVAAGEPVRAGGGGAVGEDGGDDGGGGGAGEGGGGGRSRGGGGAGGAGGKGTVTGGGGGEGTVIFGVETGR